MLSLGHAGFGMIISFLTKQDYIPIIIGAVIPDIDTLPYLFGQPYRKFHRTFTHSMFAPLIALMISPLLALGVLTHLIIDVIVYPGIKLFHPFSSKEYYIYKGNFEKFHDPKLFLQSIKKRKWLITLELIMLVAGALLMH